MKDALLKPPEEQSDYPCPQAARSYKSLGTGGKEGVRARRMGNGNRN